MVALASQAGVSRQLVYDHFPDLETLYETFVEDRLARYRATLPDAPALDDRHAERAVASTFRHLLTIPPSDRRIVRLLVADTHVAALDGVRARFRSEELQRWRTLVPRRDLSEGLVTALLWTTMSAFLALADAVSSGGISAEEAEAVGLDVLRALPPFRSR